MTDIHASVPFLAAAQAPWARTRPARLGLGPANAGNLAAVDEIFAPDFYSHPLRQSGTAPVRTAWTMVRERFPDLRIEAEDIVVDEDKVVVGATIHNAGPDAAGNPPTMFELLRVTDGRIAELWGVSTLHRR
ncbi:ester cyclase [Kribbella qitaiheensis]|uniref:ester cyclase n=1 Tax=Kribbella qitaiheensis TaxID=1544730 RepID=UPI00162A7132|nr:ester cyclase [Kribbella qitaiheensis]